MVFAVRCPNPQCMKYMLVEDHLKDKPINCLICKALIKLGPVNSPPKIPNDKVKKTNDR